MLRPWLTRFGLAIAVICLAVTIVSGQGSDLFRAQKDDRILYGEELDGVIRRAEWVFSLRKDAQHICGGAFIATKSTGATVIWDEETTGPVWGVTAAHCLVELDGTLSSAPRFSILG